MDYKMSYLANPRGSSVLQQRHPTNTANFNCPPTNRKSTKHKPPFCKAKAFFLLARIDIGRIKIHSQFNHESIRCRTGPSEPSG